MGLGAQAIRPSIVLALDFWLGDRWLFTRDKIRPYLFLFIRRMTRI